jgi:hypothetical protein
VGIANNLNQHIMSKCPNCGSAITCGCQRRTLSNGKAGCSKCLGKAPSVNQTSDAPVVNDTKLNNKE